MSGVSQRAERCCKQGEHNQRGEVNTLQNQETLSSIVEAGGKNDVFGVGIRSLAFGGLRHGGGGETRERRTIANEAAEEAMGDRRER